jgi:hypothetical protein
VQVQGVGSRGGLRPGWPFAKGGGGRGHCMEVKISRREMAEEAQEGRKQHLEPAELIVRSPQHASVENRHALSLNGHQVHVPVSRLGHLESCASPRAWLTPVGSLLCQQNKHLALCGAEGKLQGHKGAPKRLVHGQPRQAGDQRETGGAFTWPADLNESLRGEIGFCDGDPKLSKSAGPPHSMIHHFSPWSTRVTFCCG